MAKPKAFEARHYLLEARLLRDTVPDFEAFPFSLPAVRHLDTLELHPSVTFLIGENGTGKSTLLEAIAATRGFGRGAARAPSATPRGARRTSYFGKASRQYCNIKVLNILSGGWTTQ